MTGKAYLIKVHTKYIFLVIFWLRNHPATDHKLHKHTKRGRPLTKRASDPRTAPWSIRSGCCERRTPFLSRASHEIQILVFLGVFADFRACGCETSNHASQTTTDTITKAPKENINAHDPTTPSWSRTARPLRGLQPSPCPTRREEQITPIKSPDSLRSDFQDFHLWFPPPLIQHI